MNVIRVSGFRCDDLVRDGLHEVRFTEPGIAVDEERVVDLAGACATACAAAAASSFDFPMTK